MDIEALIFALRYTFEYKIINNKFLWGKEIMYREQQILAEFSSTSIEMSLLPFVLMEKAPSISPMAD